MRSRPSGSLARWRAPRLFALTALLGIAFTRVTVADPLFALGPQAPGVPSQPRGIATVDLNHDGRLDLVTADEGADRASVLLGNGDGTFAAAVNLVTGSLPFAVAIGDLNHDGVPDIVVSDANAASSYVNVFIGHGDGTFDPRVDYQVAAGPLSVAIADLNGDGNPDVVTVNANADAYSVLLGKGDGTFAAYAAHPVPGFGGPGGLTPWALAVGDLDGDGTLDLAISLTSGTVPNLISLLHGLGDGTFVSLGTVVTGPGPYGLVACDLNADGKLDLVTADNGATADSVTVLLGHGDGTFATAVNYQTAQTSSIASGDFDGDGKLDLAVSDTQTNLISVLLGLGDGSFAPYITFGVGATPYGIAVGDYDRDGRLDLATANFGGGTVSVLLNQGKTGQSPQLRVDVVGPQLIRAGYRTGFDLVVQNQGTVDALDVPVWLTGIPTDTAVEPGFALASPPRAPGEPDWATAPDTATSAGYRFATFVLPRVPPGVLSRRIYLTPPITESTMTLRAAITPPWTHPALPGCLSAAGGTQSPACLGSQVAALDSFVTANTQLSAVNGVALWAKVAWQCEGATSLPQALAKGGDVLRVLAGALDTPAGAGCGDALNPQWRNVANVTIVSSLDPNDKLGINETVSSQGSASYSVRFENEKTRTGAAQVVVVSDALDQSKLDLTTVSLDRICIGNLRIDPPPGLSSYATRVDLRATRHVFVDLSINLDRFTGVLTWAFMSLDTATLQPLPVNSPDGFLPPNLNPPEGEGSVLFSVRPKPALATDTQITNGASIVFDANAPMTTPVWHNTVDNTPPTSHVLPFAPAIDSASFTVRWGTTVSTPDLADFTVYVAEDNGAQRLWRHNTRATADTFTVPPDSHRPHQFAFYCSARDTSGNVEAAHPTPDAVTTSILAVGVGGPSALALEGAYPNPARGSIRAWFTLPGRTRATLDLADVAGRRVIRQEVGSLGPGRHSAVLGSTARLRPGMYFLRLTQGGQSTTSRVVLVK